jgi:hypothetical protein
VGNISAGPVVALKVEAGAVGFFVVVLLCIAAAGIFAMMSRSLTRMRGNVASGEFRGTDSRRGRERVGAQPSEARVSETPSSEAPVSVPSQSDGTASGAGHGPTGGDDDG